MIRRVAKMKFTESEIKIINQSVGTVNRWCWYKWVLVVAIIASLIFIVFKDDNYAEKYSLVITLFIGGGIGYLISNWSTPKKEALLVKLSKNKEYA